MCLFSVLFFQSFISLSHRLLQISQTCSLRCRNIWTRSASHPLYHPLLMQRILLVNKHSHSYRRYSRSNLFLWQPRVVHSNYSPPFSVVFFRSCLLLSSPFILHFKRPVLTTSCAW